MKVLFLLLLYYNIDNHKYSLNLFLSSGYNYFTNHSDALKFLYPRGFSTPDFEKRAILASTNTITDEWNSMIQGMNPAQPSTLFSSDIVDEVDDPHGIINDMLNSDTLLDEAGGSKSQTRTQKRGYMFSSSYYFEKRSFK